MTDLKPEDRALTIVSAKLSSFPDHGARDGAAVYKITGDELGVIRDVLAARAEGRRSPGDPALEAGCLPERLTDQCADAWPRPHSHDMLAWLAERPSLELDYGFDAEEEDMFWRVHERSGSINDREWDLIGQGATPLAALLSAKSYMESTNAEQPE